MIAIFFVSIIFSFPFCIVSISLSSLVFRFVVLNLNFVFKFLAFNSLQILSLYNVIQAAFIVILRLQCLK